MSAPRLRTLFAGGGIAALAAVAVAVGGSTPVVAANQSAGAQAEALASAPAPDAFDAASTHASGRAAEAQAEKVSGQVPLPPGEAFDDIAWDNGNLTEADIQGLLEANAACKWWMADADAPTKETARVVAAIPGWPTMRGGDRHAMAVAMLNRRDAEFAKSLLRTCRSELG